MMGVHAECEVSSTKNKQTKLKFHDGNIGQTLNPVSFDRYIFTDVDQKEAAEAGDGLFHGSSSSTFCSDQCILFMDPALICKVFLGLTGIRGKKP